MTFLFPSNWDFFFLKFSFLVWKIRTGTADCYCAYKIYFQSKPYLQLKKQDEDGIPLVGNAQYEGYCADLAKDISELVKIEYIIKLVADGKYGNKMLDGTWNGMVGELTREVRLIHLASKDPRKRVTDEMYINIRVDQ